MSIYMYAVAYIIISLTWTKPTTTLGVGPSVLLLLEREGRDLERPNVITNYRYFPSILYIAGVFRVYKFSRKCLYKGFHGFNVRGIAPFCSMHACDIKFAFINVRGTCLIRENHELFVPSKYTRYTVSRHSRKFRPILIRTFSV